MKTALRNMGTIITGNTPSKGNEDYWNSSDICFVKPDIIADSGITVITETIEHISEAARSKARIVGEGTIFVTCIGSIGKIAIASTNEYAFNQQINAIVPYESFNSRYLAYALLYAKPRLTAIANAPVVPIINKSQFGEFELEIEESIDKQVAIVDLLDKISGIIDARQKQIHTLDILIKARFVEMFEQGDYPCVEFGEICEFLRNGANIKQTKGASGIPITRIETLANDVFNIDRLGYADIFELVKYESYLLKPGDILISHINSIAYLGRAVQYRGQMSSPIIHGMNLLCARITKRYNPTYIEFFFKSPAARDYISSITKKAVNQASITTSDLKKMMVPAPSLEKQNEFDRFVQQVDKSKTVIQHSLERTQLLFESLLQHYFG